MENKEQGKKQIPLRLSLRLWEELNRWAADDFRSLNGQIEYLLTECVKARRKELPPAEPGLPTVVSGDRD
ncbi:MAG: Arc family DNA-binding protein [Treponema sp.]|nr:Arc family DNA-binding protein [Treponema sp.]